MLFKITSARPKNPFFANNGYGEINLLYLAVSLKLLALVYTIITFTSLLMETILKSPIALQNKI